MRKTLSVILIAGLTVSTALGSAVPTYAQTQNTPSTERYAFTPLPQQNEYGEIVKVSTSVKDPQDQNQNENIQNVGITGFELEERGQSPNVTEVQAIAAATVGQWNLAVLKARLETALRRLVDELSTLFSFSSIMSFLGVQTQLNEQDVADAQQVERAATDSLWGAINLMARDYQANLRKKTLQDAFELENIDRIQEPQSIGIACDIVSRRLGATAREYRAQNHRTFRATVAGNLSSGVASFGSSGNFTGASGGNGGGGSGSVNGGGGGSGSGGGNGITTTEEEATKGPQEADEAYFNEILPRWCNPDGEGGKLNVICDDQYTSIRPGKYYDDIDHINRDSNFAKAFFDYNSLTIIPPALLEQGDNVRLERFSEFDTQKINYQATSDFIRNLFPTSFIPLEESKLKQGYDPETGSAKDTNVVQYLVNKRRFDALRSIPQATFAELQARRVGAEDTQVNYELQAHIVEVLGIVIPGIEADKQGAIETYYKNLLEKDENNEVLTPQEEIMLSIGLNPSKEALLEVLARRQFTSPTFLTKILGNDPDQDLKPEILESSAMRSIVMKDLLDSMLRTEAITAGVLELMVRDLKDDIEDLNNSLLN